MPRDPKLLRARVYAVKQWNAECPHCGETRDMGIDGPWYGRIECEECGESFRASRVGPFPEDVKESA